MGHPEIKIKSNKMCYPDDIYKDIIHLAPACLLPLSTTLNVPIPVLFAETGYSIILNFNLMYINKYFA